MTVEQVKEKVQRILVEALGSVSIDKDGDFFVRHDSTVVYVRVSELRDDATIVKSWAILLNDVPLTPEVYRWVATEGQEYFFGHARLVETEEGKGRIQFEHILLGDFLDPDELEWAVIALGNTTDQLDDELKAKFGGSRFIEG